MLVAIQSVVYEVCPKSIPTAFISLCQSVRQPLDMSVKSKPSRIYRLPLKFMPSVKDQINKFAPSLLQTRKNYFENYANTK